MRLTAILKIKTTIQQLAAECLELFGEGARPDAVMVLYYFALNNSAPQNGYIRIIVAQHIALALEWITETGYVSENGEVIAIEWDGQQDYQVGTDANGNPEYLTRFVE